MKWITAPENVDQLCWAFGVEAYLNWRFGRGSVDWTLCPFKDPGRRRSWFAGWNGCLRHWSELDLNITKG